MLLRLLLLLAVCAAPLTAFPSGAPTEACIRGMVPNHSGTKSQDIRTMPFSVKRQTLSDGVRVTIRSQGDRYFKGFMVQARVPGTEEAATSLGSWQPVENVSLMNECAALTHSDRSEKTAVTVTWKGRSPVSMQFDQCAFGSVTVLENYRTFWAAMEVPEAGSAGGPAAGPAVVRRQTPPQSQQFAPVVDRVHFDPALFQFQ